MVNKDNVEVYNGEETGVAGEYDMQTYGMGEVQLRDFLKKKPGLNKSLMPVLRQFTELGFSKSQLEAIVEIPYNGAKERGRNQKVKWFMDAVRGNYSTDHLASMVDNYTRFSNFLALANEAENLREDIGSNKEPTTTYKLCFDLIHELGCDRTRLLLERLVEESETEDTKLWKKIKALYTIKEIVEESKNTGYSPETILSLRRNEIDKSMYVHFDDEED
jgi:hypothetical protein